MNLKIMTFNICHGADYQELLATNQSPNGPLCFGYELTEKLLQEENASELIETWQKNVNLEQVADVICQYDCDIIGLNEVRGAGDSPYYSNQAELLGKMTGREFAFAKAVEFSGEGSYGTAILSRFPIKSCETIRIPPMKELQNREPRIFLKAVLLVPEEVTVFVSHFGGHPKEQELAVETFLREIEDISTPVILMGDFNTTPDSGRLDSIYEVMEEAFFKDNRFTFPSFHPVRKIDYIFANHKKKNIHFSKQEVIPKIISDHYPLFTEVIL